MEVKKSKLSILLDAYQQQSGQGETYKDVLMELITGESLLFLPSVNDGSENQEANNQSATKTLKIASIFTVDGIKVLGAFSDEAALFIWAKQPVPYKMLESKDVLQICEENGIKRVVINSNQPTMFVLEQG